MGSIEILESKLRVFISKTDKLFNDYGELLKEVKVLKENVTKLELEKEDIKKTIEGVINKVEQYLNNTGN
ncbi:MAG: hypothetical protein ACRENO_01825 [Thermodesulfobacteriota bacterium]